MITTNIPKITPKTLYEASTLTEGLDIADRDWDMATYFECPESWEETHDGYDKFMLLLGCNIQVDQYAPEGYTTCNIADFMWENRNVFDPFFNTQNRSGYRPKDYKDLDPETDNGFYEVYMQTFESLVAGNYSDSDYEFLYNELMAQNSEKGENK